MYRIEVDRGRGNMAKKTRAKRNANNTGGVRQLPSGNWQVYVTEEGKMSARGTYPTERGAEAARASIVVDRNRGVDASPDKVTFAEYTTRYLEQNANLKDSTRLKFRQEMGYLLVLLGSRPLQSLRADDLKKALAKLSQKAMTSGRGKGKSMSARTLGKIVTHTKAVFRAALESRILYTNPAESLKKPKGSPTRKETVARVLDPTQLNRLLSVGEALYQVGACRLWPALFTTAMLGLRKGEVMGLEWQHVRFEDETLQIHQALTIQNGKPEIVSTKTDGSERDLPMYHNLINMFRALKAAQQTERERTGALWKETGAVFATEVGTFTHPDNLNRSLTNVLEWTDPAQLEMRLKSLPRNVPPEERATLRAAVLEGEKLPHITPHDLRHTYATLALSSGLMRPEVVSKLLGHSKVSTTLDIYRHVFDSEKRQGAVDLNSLLAGLEKPKSSESVSRALN